MCCCTSTCFICSISFVVSSTVLSTMDVTCVTLPALHTRYAMPGDRDKCLEHGMTDYITKPVSKQALRRMVARYITHSRSSSTRSVSLWFMFMLCISCSPYTCTDTPVNAVNRLRVASLQIVDHREAHHLAWFLAIAAPILRVLGILVAHQQICLPSLHRTPFQAHP